MDDFDRKILRVLQEQPDLTMTDLADRVGLSHTPCWRRLKRLEEEGVILGRALLLDARKLGFGTDVFAHVKVKRHEESVLEEFEAAALACPEIVECFLMSGEDDFLLRVVAEDVAEYEKLLKRVLLHLPGVQSVSSSFALKRVKVTAKLPLKGG